jgi:hypothetical protein
MNDTKFLGLCILLAACIISGTIIWSTKASQGEPPPPIPLTASAAAPTTVTISGPVQLAPFPGPIPVTISTTDGNPIVVKDAANKQWTR